jgi:hypothetical protein
MSSGYTRVFAITAPAAPATALPHGGSTSTLDCPAIVVLVEPRNQSVGMDWRGSGCGRVWDVCVDGSLRMLSHDLYKPTSQAPVVGVCTEYGGGRAVGRHVGRNSWVYGGAHDETQISRGSGPRGPSSAFPGRSPHLLTASLRYAATPLLRYTCACLDIFGAARGKEGWLVVLPPVPACGMRLRETCSYQQTKLANRNGGSSSPTSTTATPHHPHRITCL